MTIRDADYYDEDGNVVFCAQDVLFKVHRSRLTRRSAVFKSMFDIPCEAGNVVEGSSDMRPIMLQDSVDDIRSLLWVLDLLPPEVTALFQEEPTEELCMRMLRVVALAHKYEFEHIDRWALDAVLRFLDPVPFSLSSELIEMLLAVSPLCGLEDLHGAEKIARTALDRGRADLGVVLRTAEELGFSGLAGHVYLLALRAGSNSVAWRSLPYNLRINLLAGYHSLTELWLAMSRAPPLISRHQCVHRGPCLWMWGEIWKDCVSESRDIPPSDPLGKLRAIRNAPALSRERSGRWPDKGGELSFICRAGAYAVIDDRINEIESNLIDFFRVPTDIDIANEEIVVTE